MLQMLVETAGCALLLLMMINVALYLCS